MTSKNAIRVKYLQINPSLNEKSRRLWCAIEALALGKGEITLVHRATKVCRPTNLCGHPRAQKETAA